MPLNIFVICYVAITYTFLNGKSIKSFIDRRWTGQGNKESVFTSRQRAGLHVIGREAVRAGHLPEARGCLLEARHLVEAGHGLGECAEAGEVVPKCAEAGGQLLGLLLLLLGLGLLMVREPDWGGAGRAVKGRVA